MAPIEFPDFDLPLAGGGRLRREDMAGRAWIAYLARHPGWSICQRHLRRAVEALDEIAGGDADLVVFYNADLDLVEEWRDDFEPPAELRVAADPEGTLYRALGTKRQDPVRLMVGSIGAGLRSASQGILPRRTRADMLRLGADAAVEADGSIALLHVASSPDDRVPMHDLLAALDGGTR